MSGLFDTPSRLPQDQPGRDLRCTACQALVRVTEIPRPFIDHRLYVCGVCLEAGGGQLELDPPQRRPDEVRVYDPAIARIPYGEPEPMPGEPVIPR